MESAPQALDTTLEPSHAYQSVERTPFSSMESASAIKALTESMDIAQNAHPELSMTPNYKNAACHVHKTRSTPPLQENVSARVAST